MSSAAFSQHLMGPSEPQGSILTHLFPSYLFARLSLSLVKALIILSQHHRISTYREAHKSAIFSFFLEFPAEGPLPKFDKVECCHNYHGAAYRVKNKKGISSRPLPPFLTIDDERHRGDSQIVRLDESAYF